MKNREELQELSQKALEDYTEDHELSNDEKFYFKSGWIRAYQELEEKLNENVVLGDVNGSLNDLCFQHRPSCFSGVCPNCNK